MCPKLETSIMAEGSPKEQKEHVLLALWGAVL